MNNWNKWNMILHQFYSILRRDMIWINVKYDFLELKTKKVNFVQNHVLNCHEHVTRCNDCVYDGNLVWAITLEMRDPGYQPITAREDKISTNRKPGFHPFLNPVVFTPVITTNKHSVIVSEATSYNILKYFWSLFKYCVLTWWWPRRMDCPPVNCWYWGQPRI